MDEFKIDKIDSSVIEPLRKNRFIVEFPKNYQIPQWAIRNFTFLDNNEVEIKIMEIVGSCYICRFNDMPKIGELDIKLLDPTNTPLLNMGLTKVKVVKITPDKLDYKTDEIFEFTLRCKYKKIKYGPLY